MDWKSRVSVVSGSKEKRMRISQYCKHYWTPVGDKAGGLDLVRTGPNTMLDSGGGERFGGR